MFTQNIGDATGLACPCSIQTFVIKIALTRLSSHRFGLLYAIIFHSKHAKSGFKITLNET